MAIKKGLGKGLDSLIAEKLDHKVEKKIIEENVSCETLVKLTLIEPGSNQPRKNFNEDSLQELAD